MNQKAHKIFVEPDEEITFTIEKIRNVGGTRAILVVPQNAALVSSAVSLKILSRQVLSTDKLVALVTDDQGGKRLSEKAGLICLQKISEVNKDVWQKAKELKVKMISERDKIRAELIGDRSETIDKEITEQKTVKASLEDDVKAETKEPEQLRDKPRLDAKVISINGINIVAGGDITQLDELLRSERERLNFEPDSSGYRTESKVAKVEFKNQEKNLEDLREQSDVAQGITPAAVLSAVPVPRKSFVGRDLTKMIPGKEQIQSKLQTRELKSGAGKIFTGAKEKLGPLFKGKSTARMIQGFIVIVVLFFLYSYLFLPAVSINLVFQENQVRVNETVTASPDIDKVDLDNLKIPANVISKATTTSKDGISTGKANKGDKAQGVVDIFNNTDTDVTFKAGTKITNIATALNYELLSDVTVKKNLSATDLGIRAETFGENYNIINQQKTFKFPSFASTDVSGRNFRDITGGTTKEVVVASKEDIDSLKASAEEELKTQLLENLKSLISDQDIMLTGSEQFKEDSFKSSLQANDEGDKFTVDVQMTVSALTVLKTNLKTIAEQVVKDKGQSNASSQVNLSDPVIQGIKIGDDKVATFTLTSKADVTANIDENELKGKVAGLSVNDARETLAGIQGVKDYRLRYTPIYIPFFLQKVPTDLGKIEITKSVDNGTN